MTNLFFILITVVFMIIGCHRMIPGVQFVQPSVMHSEIDRFEQAKGIPCSDIPVIYDISPLKVGSMVKYKMVDSRIPDKSFILSTTLNDIKITDNGEQYTIESAGTNIFVNRLNGKIACDESEAEQKRKIMKSIVDREAKRAITEAEKNLEQEKANAIIDVIMYGLVVGTITAVEDIKLAEKVIEMTEKYPEVHQEMEAKTEGRIKVIDFKLISEENLLISGKSVPCKIYQFDKMTLIRSPFYDKNGFKFQESVTIMNESTKWWVSDEIPFGIAKREMRLSTLSETNKQVIRTDDATIVSEAVEFKY